MASGLASGTALRHLHDLFNGGTAVGLTDGQLLARYTASNDGPAFAALVARHGPMVAATCRAILQREHDVEDAFQATFLVLARKAGSVRAGDVLGGWLHRVAYRIAVQANIELKRRRRRESDVSPMDIPATVHSVPDLELLAIVHEEIDRLPERQRLPVVLCDLEGLSYEQAATRLNSTVPALRCQLSKARERLRARLTRRGVTATAMAVAMASTTDASTAVATSWTEAAVAAATGGASSAAATLAQTVLRRILMTKLTIVAAATLAMTAIVSAEVFFSTAQPDDRKPEMKAVATSSSLAAIGEQVPRKATPSALIEVHGRVVDPDGKPVSGATVRTAFLDREIEPAPEATSGPDGRFFLRVPPSLRNWALLRRDAMFPWVVASASGFGPGWASAVREPGALGEVAIRLVADGPPIEGRIVDLEGRPVAGARVKAERVWFARDGKLSDWLANAADRGVSGFWPGLDHFPTGIMATTGNDGRFRLPGTGRDRIAELSVSGPTIATAELYVVNCDESTTYAINIEAMMPERTVFRTRRFEHVAAPTKPIEGIICDKDTGRAIAGLTLHGAVFEGNSFVPAPGVETTTDAQGHYRLTGLPKGPAYRLFLGAGRGVPYANAAFRVAAESPALEPVNFDIKLKRGVVVRGQVTDKATGRPVTGYGHVNAYTFADNPHVNEIPGYRSSNMPFARIESDGRYEVVTLPGHGLIACRSDLGLYRGYVGAEAIKEYDPKEGSLPMRPQSCTVRDYHVLAEINLDPKVESATVNLEVDPGRTLAVTAVDPAGKPVSGTRASGLTDLASADEYEQDSSAIEIRSLHPSKPRRVTISHPARKLVVFVYLKGDETGTLTVRLQPWGTITGRIVDDEGQPRGGLALNNLGGIYPEPPADRGILPNSNFSPGIGIGRDGRFRIEGLVPGLKYSASAVEGFMYRGDVFKDEIVASGEVKNLGDLKVVPPKRDGQE
jgi:RNA polymerase sigma factor (sigma-70 family)